MRDVPDDQTPARREAQPTDDPPLRAHFGPQPIALLPVLILALGALPLAGSRLFLLPLLLVPLGCAVWVLRARVVADSHGLTVSNGLGRRRVAWRDIEALDVRARRPVRLCLRDDRSLWLSPLTRRDVPRLLKVAAAAGHRSTRQR